MPKMKTRRGAAKRFKAKAKGGFKFRRMNRNHILTKITTKRKRHLRANSIISKADNKAIKKMLAGS